MAMTNLYDQIKDDLKYVSDEMSKSNLDSIVMNGEGGYHIFVASDGGIEQYWRIALTAAIWKRWLDYDIHVDDDMSIEGARLEVEYMLKQQLDEFLADDIAIEFENELRKLVEDEQ